MGIFEEIKVFGHSEKRAKTLSDTLLHRYLELAMGQESTLAVSLVKNLTVTDSNQNVTFVTEMKKAKNYDPLR